MMKAEDKTNRLQNREAFLDLEYFFRQYYDEHCRKHVHGIVQNVEKKQLDEAIQIRKKYAGVVGGSTTGLPVNSMLADQEIQRGEWNSLTVEDIFNKSSGKIFSDEHIVHDYVEMIAAYRAALVSELGKKEYDRLSKRSECKDLAVEYVSQRFSRMMLEQVLKEHEMPKSTAEYLLQQMAQKSVLGMLSNISRNISYSVNTQKAAGFGKDSAHQLLGMDEASAVKAFYNPSSSEKTASTVLNGLLDTAAFLPMGGMSVAAVGVGATLDVGFHAWDEYKDGKQGHEPTADEIYSSVVFKDAGLVDELRHRGTSSGKRSSERLSLLNKAMDNRVKTVKVGGVHLDHSANKSTFEKLFMEAGNDGHAVMEVAEAYVSQAGIKLNKEKSIPGWMLKNKLETNATNAAYYLGLYDEMVIKGSKKIVVGKNTLTLQQVAQRGYDYARAAEARQQTLDAQQQLAFEKAQEEQRAIEAALLQKAGEVPAKVSNPQQSVTPNISAKQMASNLTNVEGWGGLLNKLGLNGFGDVGRNLGYVMAMLPEIMIGMFTGKLKNFKLQDNLFPLASILMGVFIKNPFLKMLLIGFGGANLLNKAGHLAMGGNTSQQQVRPYKAYDNELLNTRIKDPAIKGNTMVASIDNIPCVITISDDAIDAYHKGFLPLNTLSNAVLRKWDEQQASVIRTHEEDISMVDEQNRSIGIK